MQTPAGSDDGSEEEHGDYDDVVGYIPGYVSPSNRMRSRSLANSYADLQQLKKASEHKRPLHPEDHHLTPRKSLNPIVVANGNGFNGHANPAPPETSPVRRNRKSSLSDNVQVERLAQLDPQEAFKDCTQDINMENQLRRRKDPGPIDGQPEST